MTKLIASIVLIVGVGGLLGGCDQGPKEESMVGSDGTPTSLKTTSDSVANATPSASPE